jgi:hypothetical protein
MPSRVVGCVIYPDKRIVRVRLVKGQVEPADGTVDKTKLTDPMIVQAVKLGGLAILYKGTEDPDVRTTTPEGLRRYGGFITEQHRPTSEERQREYQARQAEKPQRRPVAQASLL